MEGTKGMMMMLLLLSCWFGNLASAMVVPTKVRTSPLSAASASFSTATQIIGAKLDEASSKLPEKERERFSDFFNKITPTTGVMDYDLTAWTKEFEPSALLNKLIQTTSKVEEEKKPVSRQTLKAKVQAVKAAPKRLQIVKETPITPVSEDVRNVFAKMEETKNSVAKSISIPQFDLSEWVLKNTPADTNKDFDLTSLTGSKEFDFTSFKVGVTKPAVKQALKAVPMKQPVKPISFKRPVKAIVPMKQPVKASVVPVKQLPVVGKLAAVPKVSSVSFKPIVKAAAPKVSNVSFKPKPVVKSVQQKIVEEKKVLPAVKSTPVTIAKIQQKESTKQQEVSKPAVKPIPVPVNSVIGKTSPLSAASASFSTAKEIIGAKLAEQEKSKMSPSTVTNMFAQMQGLGAKKTTEVKPVGKITTIAPKVSSVFVKPVVKVVVQPAVKVAIKPDTKSVVKAVVKPVEVKAVEPKKAEVKNVQPKSVVSVRSSQGSKPIAAPEQKSEYNWAAGRYAFSLLPLAPGDRRKTLLAEVVKGTIWTLDQIQGIINVNVPVRAVVVKLSGGGLLIFNPVGPTEENLALVRGLEAKHGPVKHIVLASLGLEHKAFTGPFSQEFPDATVWIQPGQWSFPFNLPPSQLGFPSEAGRVKEIPLKASDAPWFKDFDHCVLEKLSFKSVGGFGETAFFHRSTGTLLVTDAVIKVGSEPPPIIQEDPRAILYHSRDSIRDDVFDTPDARKRGYRRMALFSLFFYPSGIQVTPWSNALSELSTVSSQARILGEGSLPFAGLYPWTWVTSEEKNFQALQGGLLVAPILRKLILDREPRKVLAWADKVSQWPMKRIIPSHFENNIAGSEFRAAFKFLEPPRAVPLNGYNPSSGPAQPDLKDLRLLDAVSDLFTSLGIVAASQVAKRVN